MSEITTPRPWPNHALPSPTQLADWIAVLTPEERVTLAERMLHDAEAASRCFIRDHEARLQSADADLASVARANVLADKWARTGEIKVDENDFPGWMNRQASFNAAVKLRAALAGESEPTVPPLHATCTNCGEAMTTGTCPGCHWTFDSVTGRWSAP